MRVYPVTFRYRGPAPVAISVVGSFNHWDPVAHPLLRGDGEWRITLFLPPGTYPYAFAVGDRLIPDPDPARGPLGCRYSVVIVAADPSPVCAA